MCWWTEQSVVQPVKKPHSYEEQSTEGHAWCQPSKGQYQGLKLIASMVSMFAGSCVWLSLSTSCLSQPAAHLQGLHKHHHHLFSQYHQHHTYCLEDFCQLQLNHHFFWPGEDAEVHTYSPISHQMSPMSLLFFSSTMSTAYFRWKIGILKEAMHTNWVLFSYSGHCFFKSSILQTTLIFKLMLKNKN